MKIINLGHACFKIIDEGISVIFDPYQDDSVPNLKLENNIETNYLFVSHEHHDHNAREKVKIIPTDKVLKYEEVIVNHDDQNGNIRGKCKAVILNFDDYSIAHLGDIGDIEDERIIDKFKGVDIILCPINGYYTIGAKEAIGLINYLKPKHFIPMHYYKQDSDSGYFDNDQIEIFLSHFDSYLKVNKEIKINQDIKEQIIIFE